MRLRRPPPQESLRLPATGRRRRWGARVKAAVVLALRLQVLSRSEAYERYQLSAEELDAWEAALDRDGIAGLQARSLARRNRPK